MTLFQSLILGIVEGITEFLPVSSTGHLILTSHFLGIVQTDSFLVFEIAIQLGALCAVATLLWRLLLTRDMLMKLCVAFAPTALAGFTLFAYIKPLLTDERIVAYALVLGGAAILCIEHWYSKRDTKHNTAHADETEGHISYRDSFILGCAQCLAFIPGTSRSGAVMMSALLLKKNRKVASEFTFLLALPTMAAATLYALLKHRDLLTLDLSASLLVGGLAAFVTALCVVAAFLKYIRTHTFVPFGWYRIAFGTCLLLFLL